jgi:hypothetical protein
MDTPFSVIVVGTSPKNADTGAALKITAITKRGMIAKRYFLSELNRMLITNVYNTIGDILMSIVIGYNVRRM